MRNIRLTQNTPFLKATYLAFSLCFSIPSYAGGDEEAPLETDCNDPRLLMSQKNHPNPFKDKQRLNNVNRNDINHEFHAFLEGKKDGTYPVYYFEEVCEVRQCIQTVMESVPQFDRCGRYCGSVCVPRTIICNQNTPVLKLSIKWAHFSDLCRQMESYPEWERRIVGELKGENIYGAFTEKNFTESRNFLNDYQFQSHESPKWDKQMSLYDKDGNPVDRDPPSTERSAKKQSKKLKYEEIPEEELDTPEPSNDTREKAAPSAPSPMTPAPTKSKAKTGQIPYGIPIPGKKGFVYSPNVPQSSGMVDVRDLAPGTQVQDPYADNKTFLVP